MAIAAKTVPDLSTRLQQLYEKGLHALRAGNAAYAAEVLANLLREEPGCAAARKALLEARLAAAGGPARGWSRLVAAMRLVWPLQRVGPALLRQGKAEAALGLADELLRIDPSARGTLLFLARSAEAAGLGQVALDALEFAVRLHAADPAAWQALGDYCLRADLPARAVEAFRWLTERRPADRAVQKSLVQAEGIVTARERARRAAEAAAAEAAAAAAATAEPAVARSGDGIEELIAKAEGELTATAPWRVFRDLARHYVQAKRYDDAEGILKQAAARPDADPEVIDDAVAAVVQARYDDGVEGWRQYAQAHPGRAEEVRGKLAALNRERDDFLVQYHGRRVKRHPHDSRLRFELGEMLLARGEWDRALEQFEAAKNHPNLKARAYACLGKCLAAKGRAEEAVTHFQQSLEIGFARPSRDRLVVMYDLALAYEALGQSADANLVFKDIYAQEATFRDVSERMARLAASAPPSIGH
jgi:tetratricopeptide (TPR) repeat protein